MPQISPDSTCHTGYRSVFRFRLERGETARDAIERHIRDWLGARHRLQDRSALDEWDGCQAVELPSGARVEVTSYDDKRSGTAAVRFNITAGSGGEYRISITAVDVNGEAAVVTDLGQKTRTPESAIRELSPPGLVTRILSERRAFSGRTRLQSAPRVIHPSDVDEMIAAIMDQQRQVPLVVGASPGANTDDKWRELVKTLTRNSVGAAGVFVISASAVEQVNGELPAPLRIPSGHVRTIAPRVVFENPDAARHPLLEPTQLMEMFGNSNTPSVAALKDHAVSVRRTLLEGVLPQTLRRPCQLLDKEERRALLEQRVAAEVAAEPTDARLTAQSSADVPRTRFKKRSDRHKGAGSAQSIWVSFRALLASWLEVSPASIAESDTERALLQLDERIRTDRKSIRVHEEYLTSLEEDLAATRVELADAREDNESLSALLEATEEKLSEATAAWEAAKTREDSMEETAPGLGASMVAGHAGDSQENPLDAKDARSQVGDALDLLSERLDPLIGSELAPHLGGREWTVVLEQVDINRGRSPGNYNTQDPSAQLRILTEKLGQLGFPFDKDGSRTVSTCGQTLRGLRNRWSHFHDLTGHDALRTYDQVHLLLAELGDKEGAEEAARRRTKVGRLLFNGDIGTVPAPETVELTQPELIVQEPVSEGSTTTEAAPTEPADDEEAVTPDEEMLVRRDAATSIIGKERTLFEPWQPAPREDRDVLNRLVRPSAQQRVRSVAQEIVSFEGPICLDRLISFIGQEFDWSTLHEKRVRNLEQQVRLADVHVDGDGFVWPTDINPDTWAEFRPNDSSANRPFSQISPVELRNAARLILEAHPSISTEELETRVLKTFGRRRRTASAAGHLRAALGELPAPRENRHT